MNPNIDSLQEFKVTTSNYDAQFGSVAGALLQATTKSGTNSFHGSLFEYLRNDTFNAKDRFSALNLPLRWNQFGGSVGGPILKEKLFFFGDYQGTRRRRAASVITTVPTAAERSGDLTVWIDLRRWLIIRQPRAPLRKWCHHNRRRVCTRSSGHGIRPKHRESGRKSTSGNYDERPSQYHFSSDSRYEYSEIPPRAEYESRLHRQQLHCQRLGGGRTSGAPSSNASPAILTVRARSALAIALQAVPTSTPSLEALRLQAQP